MDDCGAEPICKNIIPIDARRSFIFYLCFRLCVPCSDECALWKRTKNALRQHQFISAWLLLWPQTNCNRFILIKPAEILCLQRARCLSASAGWKMPPRENAHAMGEEKWVSASQFVRSMESAMRATDNGLIDWGHFTWLYFFFVYTCNVCWFRWAKGWNNLLIDRSF